MTIALAIAGALLIVVSLVDLVWTTVAAGSGAGPITGPVTAALWRLGVTIHHRHRSHVLLSVTGVATVLSVLVVWITLVLLGWILIFSASDGAVRATDTGAPADLISRIYFAGYTVFTLGNGDYVPGQGTWQIATVVATLTGFVLITLSITYLVPVASAVAQGRQLASYIATLGPTPAEIVTRSWTGTGFGSLSQHLVSLTALVHSTRQQHLAYPILHYFHSQDRESAIAPAMANLSDALLLLRHGVAREARPDPAATRALDAAVGSFLDTLAETYIKPGDEALPPPPLENLRHAEIPTVDDESFRNATRGTQERRRKLAAFLRDDGWPIDARSNDHDREPARET